MADTGDYRKSRSAALEQLTTVRGSVAAQGLVASIAESIAYAQVHATLALAAAIDSLGAASTTLNPPPGEHTGDQQ